MQLHWTNTTGHLGYDQQVPGWAQHRLAAAVADVDVGGGGGGVGEGEPQLLRDVRHRHHQ